MVSRKTNFMVRKYMVLLIALWCICFLNKTYANNYTVSDTTPFPTFGYNASFYPTVLQAAIGLAQPFLVQEGYFSLPNVTTPDTSLLYNSVKYPTSEEYLNPTTGYYIPSSLYSYYGISSLSTIWPTQCPNAIYDTAKRLFTADIDCVGYGTRLLAAVGDATTTNNAYLNLMNTIHTNNITHFAYTGYVASAYEFAVSFPTLTTSPVPGWQYIAGGIEDSSINAYNKSQYSTTVTYVGANKGGFAQCQGGDVLAFGYGASASSNGHFMILENQPQLLNTAGLQAYYPSETTSDINALLAAYNVYAVNVFDDSGEEAHFNDSRKNYGGIGHGTLLILTTLSNDTPTGFIFAPTNSISYNLLDPSVFLAISVGRFTGSTQSLIIK
jgi:hypothetical protein